MDTIGTSPAIPIHLLPGCSATHVHCCLVASLGGEQGVIKAAIAPNQTSAVLPLNFRPRDPLSHPIFGDNRPTRGLLLRVTRKRNPDSAAPLRTEVVARVSSIFRFTGMADFQFVADSTLPTTSPGSVRLPWLAVPRCHICRSARTRRMTPVCAGQCQWLGGPPRNSARAAPCCSTFVHQTGSAHGIPVSRLLWGGPACVEGAGCEPGLCLKLSTAVLPLHMKALICRGGSHHRCSVDAGGKSKGVMAAHVLKAIALHVPPAIQLPELCMLQTSPMAWQK